MNAEYAIHDLLSERTELTALVADRIYPVMLPQNVAVPAVLINQLSERQVIGKDGPVASGWEFQIDIMALDYPTVRQIAREVKQALNWQTRELDTGQTVRTVFDDESDAAFEPEQKYYQIVQEYRARKL
ncbi:DUF3168 domain-containing protein [Lewinella sp. JB7]|uniref:DUF3168 domain-containing protein n=1 Tax=Lewinella sp. JB7 TaxID=2962887 RepID=UPI0020C9DE86|nr:DUF3168 domain-containing protein [Lewinella sp. JB7]MCP9237156.1 DUF3168 domain-containing protein [Lewinella sp. JB7]